MQALREPGDEGIPDNLYDEINGEYNAMTDHAAARVAATDAALADSQAEIARLKAANYDLVIQVRSGSTDSDNDDIDDVPSGIDSLFK